MSASDRRPRTEKKRPLHRSRSRRCAAHTDESCSLNAATTASVAAFGLITSPGWHPGGLYTKKCARSPSPPPSAAAPTGRASSLPRTIGSTTPSGNRPVGSARPKRRWPSDMLSFPSRSVCTIFSIDRRSSPATYASADGSAPRSIISSARGGRPTPPHVSPAPPARGAGPCTIPLPRPWSSRRSSSRSRVLGGASAAAAAPNRFAFLACPSCSLRRCASRAASHDGTASAAARALAVSAAATIAAVRRSASDSLPYSRRSRTLAPWTSRGISSCE